MHATMIYTFDINMILKTYLFFMTETHFNIIILEETRLEYYAQHLCLGHTVTNRSGLLQTVVLIINKLHVVHIL